MEQTVMEKLNLEQVSRPVSFAVGDTVRVHYRITEGNKQRIQVYEGTIIAIRNGGAGKSIVVRRISYDVGVERIFPVYSPTIEKIEKVRSSKVRRSKLYYLRKKIGKTGRLPEIRKDDRRDPVFEKAQELQKAAEAAASAEAAEAASAEAAEEASAEAANEAAAEAPAAEAAPEAPAPEAKEEGKE